jgi:hypothetical protein
VNPKKPIEAQERENLTATAQILGKTQELLQHGLFPGALSQDVGVCSSWIGSMRQSVEADLERKTNPKKNIDLVQK